MEAEIDSGFGPISIVGAHLNPGTEEVRVAEIETIIGAQKTCENKIIAGDLNALSRKDGYSPTLIASFNEKQKEKFTLNGSPRYEAIDKILAAGYKDAAVVFNQNLFTTVPTPSNKDGAHASLRLDYFFMSESLVAHLVEYKVLKNEITDNASDHYPVVMALK